MSVEELENRVVDLESRLAFQDQTVNQLNEVVIRQQAEIDRVSRLLEGLKQQMESLADGLADNDGHQPPPHY